VQRYEKYVKEWLSIPIDVKYPVIASLNDIEDAKEKKGMLSSLYTLANLG
jgi:hypothetical protein